MTSSTTTPGATPRTTKPTRTTLQSARLVILSLALAYLAFDVACLLIGEPSSIGGWLDASYGIGTTAQFVRDVRAGLGLVE